MSTLTSKWIIVIVIPMVLLIFLLLIGRKSVHTELFIPAAPHQVWNVLEDTARYQHWNPVMQLIEGTLQEEGTVRYQFTQDAENSYEITAKVREIQNERLINQYGGIVGILTFNHSYELRPENEGTRVTIHEDYSGVAVPFWNPAPLEKAYLELLTALKHRVLEEYSS